MRIAFVSCIFTRVFNQQPVWDWIRAQQPDHLLLLGDSLYLDLLGPADPRDMDDTAFAQHLLQLYQELLAQPQFAALVHSLPPGAVHSIWDDHDFLWNNACGAEMHPVHSVKLRCSTVLHEAFRRALAQGGKPGSFPANLTAANLANPALASQAPLPHSTAGWCSAATCTATRWTPSTPAGCRCTSPRVRVQRCATR